MLSMASLGSSMIRICSLLIPLAVVDTSQERLHSQMHSLLSYNNDKGLTVIVSKCAVLVTGMRGLG
jgi:hypothetical protein